MSCEGCSCKAACTKAQGNREISVSLRYLRYKQQVREKLRSEEGYALSVRRMVEPESGFGQLKNNRGFWRFLLRGLTKVSLEVGCLSLAIICSSKRQRTEKQEMAVQGDNILSTAISLFDTFFNRTNRPSSEQTYLWRQLLL
ncbi:transposase [Paenibacillus sp. FSL K6-1330]|uniref:transposase n=1 Tax=Paenibacillus sp. FSL K6-1330 TaxID=2975292 RepID=UPI0030D962C9